MSRIPDCRTDEAYNENYLNEEDSETVVGYDLCVDAIQNFFANIVNWEDDIAHALGLSAEDSINIDEEMLGGDVNIDDFDESEISEMGVANAILLTLKTMLLDWAEGNRDEMITSMIEGMKNSEYEELKNKANTGEYKNAIVRRLEFLRAYEAGEVPTCWTIEKDENGKTVKIGHCPNGNIVTITDD